MEPTGLCYKGKSKDGILEGTADGMAESILG